MNKVIMIDLDGTLLRKPQFDIAPNDCEMIKKIKNYGYEVGIATGRSYIEVKYLLDKHELEVDHIIGLNGMYTKIYDEVNTKVLNKEHKIKLIDYLEEIDVEYEAQTNNDRIFTSQDYLDWLDNPMGANVKVGNGKDDDISKIVIRVFFNDKTVPEICEKLIDFHDEFNIILCNNSIIEIIAKDVDKFHEMESIINNNKELYAIGDSENDILMLKNSKVGFLIDGSNEKLKQKLNLKNIKLVKSVSKALEYLMEER